MKTAGRRIIQKSLAIAIILIMTMADLCFVGANLVSYAIDVAEVNNDNVEFKAYFPSENGALETTATTDKGDLKVAIEVGVKKDGYLSNAKIDIGNDSNFKFKTDLKNDYIKSIDEKTITLKQINEGESIKLEVGIEFAYLQESDLDYLSKVSKINLSGIYVNSKKSNTEIKGEAQLKINWISSEDIKSVLKSEILTNSIYEEDESNKRIVQLLVSSKLENNSYPVKETNIELNIPGQPEKVTVHKRTTSATNGDNEYTASEFADGKITINVKNGINNKIQWSKNVKDEFVVTIKYAETAEITNSKITSNSTLTTYDNKELKQSAESMITEDTEKLVSISETEMQKEIAKGKIYAGEEKDYKTNTKVYIDYAEMIQTLKITEKEVKALNAETEKELSVNYKNIVFNKSNISNIFGDTWDIDITDQANNSQTIDNEVEADKNGNITVELEDNAKVLYIETSEPVNNGILNYEVTKTIAKTTYSREKIKELNKIKDQNSITYTKNDETTNENGANATVNLKETESKASLKVEPVTLTTSASQEMHITAVLETDNETKDLYKNPVVKIRLPKQINKISAECRLMYGNGLELKKGNFKINEENGQEVITITLTGEQKTYEGEAVNGATLNITANVELDKLATNSSEEIVMNYTNENATSYADNGEEKVKINIASENSMILTNNIEEYEVTTLGKESDKEILLKSNTAEKNAKVKMQIVNNEEADISNIAILGKIANIDGKIERTSKVRTDVETARVYYTSVENPTTSISKAENGWKEQEEKNSKYFLVIIGSLENGKKINLSYDIKVGENLPNNLSTEAYYKISYTNNLTNTKKEAESTKLVLKTEETSTNPTTEPTVDTKVENVDIKTSITAKVQGTEIKPGDEVKAGEVVEYTVTISNNETNKVDNLTVTATIPEDTTLVELNPKFPGYDEETDNYTDTEPYYIEKTEKQLVKNNATINGKDKITLKYMVKVKEDLTEPKTETTKVSLTGVGDKAIEEEFSNKLLPATLLLNFVPISREAGEVLEPGMGCSYKLVIKNNSGVEQKNVVVTIKENELHDIDRIEYHFGDTTEEVNNNDRTFTIDSIMPNESAYVRIQSTIKQITDKTDLAQIAVNVKDSNNTEYRSNLISEEVLGEKLEVKLDTTTSANNKNRNVKIGDTIKYTATIKNIGKVDAENVKIEELISDYLNIDSIKVNGEEYDDYELNPIFEEDDSYSIMTISDLTIKQGEECVIEVIGTVAENLPTEENQLKISNKISVYANSGLLAETDINEYYIINSGEQTEDDENDNDNENSNGLSTYKITGTVWEDKDHDGERDSDESTIEGVQVFAIDVETNEIAKNDDEEVVVTTGSDGTYSLTGIPKGKYIVAFEFNTEKYMVTTYQADGVDSSKNSDAVKASRTVDGEEITAAYTDSINLTNNISNIDLGLAEAKVFSLKLDKVVSKMIITNKNGSKTYDFEDTDIAKVEIASKDLSGSNVVIEYKLKVTNVGEVAGYAKTIVDHLPASLTFNSGLNSNWYKKGNNLYTSSLADTLIEPGETKEVSLTLTKKMTESNTGLTNNKAEIETAYNSLGIQNTTTTEKNGKTTNAGSADTIIGVKTGAAVSYVALTLTIIIVICGLAYLVNKKLLLEKIEI